MKMFYLLTLGSMILLSCSSENKKTEPQRTVIAGVVRNYSDAANVLVINYGDPLSVERQFAQRLTETDGRFHAEHQYVFPQNLTIRFANKFINIFLFPGDSLFVNIDADQINGNFTGAVEFSGKNAGLNKELFHWTAHSYHIFNSQFDTDAPPAVLMESVDRDFKRAKDSIEAYSQRTGMSDFMKKWAFLDHKFIAANYLMDYDNGEADRWAVFTDPLFDVFNEDNLQTMYFQYHLSACMNALIEGDAETGRLFSEKAYAPAIRSAIRCLFGKAPAGVVRDVMLFSFLLNGLEEMPELYDSIPEIKTAFSQDIFDELLKNQIKNNTGEFSRLPESEKRLDGVFSLKNGVVEELPDVKLLNYLAEKHQNKVLYLDVWASWCGPCIEAFQYAPHLHEYFMDKDVVFINLCLSSQMKPWQAAITKNNIAGEHYFLGNNASNLFRADNNLPGFPSYLIIDKNRGMLNPAPGLKNLESAIQSIESCLE